MGFDRQRRGGNERQGQLPVTVSGAASDQPQRQVLALPILAIGGLLGAPELWTVVKRKASHFTGEKTEMRRQETTHVIINHSGLGRHPH